MADISSMHPEHASNQSTSVVDITIDTESDTARGWSYVVHCAWKSEGISEHTVTLSWVDHDQLTNGTIPPSNLVESAVRVAATAMGRTELPSRFDISSMRRAIPSFEQLLQR